MGKKVSESINFYFAKKEGLGIFIRIFLLMGKPPYC